MTKFIYAATALAFLAACDAVEVVNPATAPTTPPTTGPTTPNTGNPAQAPMPPPGPPPPVVIPDVIAGNLEAASFNQADDTMVIRITLDATELDAVYNRATIYDVPGYIAFTKQDDPLDRFFTAFHRSSADGSIQGALVVDGGQFTKYFGGAFYSQTGTYTAPVQGLVSYAGDYVGMLNAGTRDGTLDSDESFERLPARAVRVTGEVFLNADFTNTTVNGIIDERVIADAFGTALPVGLELPSLFLIPAQIAPNGSFEGAVEDIAQNNLGSYAGAFGGVNASGVAGGIRMVSDFIPDIDEEEEYGLFVLDRCGTTPTVCTTVNPLAE